MDVKTKNKLKKSYIRKFTDIYSEIAGNSKKAKELIERLADLAVILDEAREHLCEEGAVTSMDQGNYSIERENPWSKIADSKQKSYLAVMNKLDDMMPSEKEATATKAGEVLKDFISKGKPVELR